VQAIHLSAKHCVYSSSLSIATGCLVCSCVGHCAAVKETANLVLAIVLLNAV
jgi:hypothetical protein